MVSPSSRVGWRIPFAGSLTLAMSLVASGLAHAQDEPAADVEAFEASVVELRDAAQARSDELVVAMQDGCRDLAPEACLQRVVAEQIPLMAKEASGYADALEGLDVPDVYVDDVATHVAALRELAELRERLASAAAAVETTSADELDAEITILLAGLAGELSPDYAGFAFLSTFGADDYIGVFGSLTAEEREYLGGIRRAQNSAQPQFNCFGRAVNQAYGSTDQLLQALYDCGAGTALSAIEEATRALVPPVRFADEHAWLLRNLAEGSRLDRLIGDAARNDDIIAFLTNNVRLGLIQRPIPGLDAAFLSAAIGAPPTSLDPTDEQARSPYGRALFAALMRYDMMNPLYAALSADFPQVPRDLVLQAITELAPELRALETELRGAIEGLAPPEVVAADHALMLEFFDGRHARLEELFDAAEAGDADALFAIGPAADAENCATAAALSAAIAPIARPYFDPDDPDCR